MFGRIHLVLQTIFATETFVSYALAKRMSHLADTAVSLSVLIANDRDTCTSLTVCALRDLMLLVLCNPHAKKACNVCL